ncbi:MAG: hypothetical protein ACIARR_08850 [Phycisphaerales bacterium JB059]
MFRTLVLCLALLAPVASAQSDTFIEIRVVGEGEGVNGYGRVDATFLFDTGKVIQDGVVKAADATAAFSMDATPGPFDLSGGVYRHNRGAVALLELEPQNHGYVLTMYGRAPNPHVSLEFRVARANGFRLLTNTLPDRPEDYFVAENGLVQLQYAEEQGAIAAIGWGQSAGFFGGDFTVSVRRVSPEEAGVCVADLAEPYGQLDFDDILAFITSYAAGCP